MNKLIHLISLFLPWPLRRLALVKLLRYQIHPTGRIGFSWVAPERLVMGPHARIGNLTVCKGLRRLELESHARIGNGNWITGYPRGGGRHFRHLPDREPCLVVEEHAAITNRHLIDCTHAVRVGRFATVAGFGSQILTHSIDLEAGRQSCAPVRIGAYCFVGTDVVLLGGSALPDYSVLGAKSLLNRCFTEGHTLYGGVPARPLKSLAPDMAYFLRDTGFVD